MSKSQNIYHKKQYVSSDMIIIQNKRWHKMRVIAWVCFWVLFCVTRILIIVDEFVDLTSLVYTIFTWVSTALNIADLILIIICYVKIRKYRKLIKQSEGNENKVADNEENNNGDNERH